MQDSTGTITDMREMPGACPWCSTSTSATFHYGPCPERNKIKIDLHIHGSKQWNADLEKRIADVIRCAVEEA